MRYKRRSSKIILIFVVFILFSIQISFIHAQNDEEKSKVMENLSLEAMLNIKISTAGKMLERIGDIPASIVIITRDEIERYGYISLTEILENIPGLYSVDDYGIMGVKFGVRGFWSGVTNDNIIILINDIPQTFDLLSNYPLTKIAVPVEAIDRIEFVRGPMSVIYGSGAFYGVINIITNETFNSKPKRIVSASFGSFDTYKLFVSSAGHKNNFHYVINGGYNDTNGIDEPLKEMMRNPETLPFFGVPIDQKTGGRLEDSEKFFNLSGKYDTFYVEMSYIESEKETFFNLPSPTKGSFNRHTTSNITLGYKKEISDIISIDGKINYSHSRWWGKYDFLFENFYGIEQMEANSFEFEFNTVLRLSSELNLMFGINNRSILNVYDMYDLPSFGSISLLNNYFYLSEDDDIVTRSLYAQLTYIPSDKLRIVTGLRLEQMPKYGLNADLASGTEYYSQLEGIYDRDEIEIIPRFAAIYSIDYRNIIKFFYGKATNRPSFFLNTKNTLDPFRNDLEPESIQTFELNYLSFFAEKFSINVSIFRNSLKNLITRIILFDENNNYESWSGNAGEMVTDGIELTVQSEPWNGFKIELSGIYQKTKDKRDGFEELATAYSPNFLGYIKTSYRFSDSISFALNGRYVGKMETFWDETIPNSDGTFGNRIGDPSPGYFILGTNLRVRNIFNTGLYLNIRCSNLLNELIRYPTFTSNRWADRGTIGYGRRFLITLGWNY